MPEYFTISKVFEKWKQNTEANVSFSDLVPHNKNEPKRVLNVYNRNLNFIKSFDSITNAGESLNMSNSAISKAIYRKNKYKNFYFKWSK